MLVLCALTSQVNGNREDFSREKKKMTHQESDSDFEGEPGVAKRFNVKEGFVCIRLVLVQRPDSPARVILAPDGDSPIEDDRHPHVGVSLDAKGKNGYTNEEHGYHSDDLKRDNSHGSDRGTTSEAGIDKRTGIYLSAGQRLILTLIPRFLLPLIICLAICVQLDTGIKRKQEVLTLRENASNEHYAPARLR